MRSKLLFGILQKRAACSRTSEHPLPGISPYWEAIEPFLHVVKPGGIKKRLRGHPWGMPENCFSVAELHGAAAISIVTCVERESGAPS